MPNPWPTRHPYVQRKHLISDQDNDQVFEIHEDGSIVFSYGEIGVVGRGPNQLKTPYDAEEIGRDVGLTPPFGRFFAPQA